MERERVQCSFIAIHMYMFYFFMSEDPLFLTGTFDKKYGED